MKSTEKFYREVHAEALANADGIMGAAVTVDPVRRAVTALGELIDILAERDKQAKARRERIEWIRTSLGTYVARVGRTTYEFSPARKMVSRLDEGRAVRISGSSKVTSIESASRLIRRLNGAKK